MKFKIVITIIILMFTTACQNNKKTENFALVVTPIELPFSSKQDGDLLKQPMPFYDYMSLHDYLKNKGFKIHIISKDPLIYKIPDQKGLLEELAKMLKTIKTIMNVCSMNIANQNTTKTLDGTPYRRKTLIINKDFEILRIVTVETPFKRVYDPKHPDAEATGYVLYPNVNKVEEQVQITEMQNLWDSIAQIIRNIYKCSVVSKAYGYDENFSTLDNPGKKS